MPVKVAANLPAIEELKKENIFVMAGERADTQDIRPLRLCILNLMPVKETTEIQLLRLIGNSPLQAEIVLLHPKTHLSKNTNSEHLSLFYKTFDEVKHTKFDGLIVTGAPVETLEFEQVDYWNELKEILDWADSNVYSSLFICWAAQAALYNYFKIHKYPAKSKISGIFSHEIFSPKNPIMRGFDDNFLAPHSRNTETRKEDILANPDLELLAASPRAGVYLACTKDLRKVFVTGHGEYDLDTLHNEYLRDISKGMNIDVPENYYVNGVLGQLPPMTWRSHSMLLMTNWLNYCVYQATPYDYLDN